MAGPPRARVLARCTLVCDASTWISTGVSQVSPLLTADCWHTRCRWSPSTTTTTSQPASQPAITSVIANRIHHPPFTWNRKNWNICQEGRERGCSR